MVKDTINWAVGTGITVAAAGIVLRGMDQLVPRRRKKKKRYSLYGM